MKRNALIIAVLALAACIGGALYMQNGKVEAARRFIDGLPGTIKAGRIDVALFGNTIEIHDLAGEFAFFADAPYDVAVETLILEGVNPKAFETPGVVKLVDRVYAKNHSLKAKGRSYPLLFAEMTCDESETKGIWMDTGAFRALTAPEGEAFIDAMLSVRFGPSTSGASRTAWVTPVGSRGPGSGGGLNVMTADKTVAGPYSLAEFGKIDTYGVTMIEEGLYTARMKEAHITSGKNPRSIYSMMATGETDPNQALAVFTRMMQEGYALRGLEALDLEIEINGVPGMIKTPRLSADVALGVADILCRIESASLTVPTSTAALLDPELAFLEQSMDALDLRVLFDINTARESEAKGTIDLAVELDEPRLGDAALSVSLGGRPMSGPGAYLPLDTSTIGLAGLKLRLTDREFLALLFPDAPGDEPGAARRAYAEAMLGRAREERLPEGFTEALERMGEFIRQSGSYEYDVTVTNMVSFMALAWNPDAFFKGLRMEARHLPLER